MKAFQPEASSTVSVAANAWDVSQESGSLETYERGKEESCEY